MSDYSSIFFYNFLSQRLFGDSAQASTKGKEMHKDRLITVSQATCEHAKQRHYTQTRFDVLNGFEIVLTRCINCHKILAMEVKKLS